ncbi:MAG TPA: PIG-L family deacetylase [bacterium]|nr:PIG-L family deacetylase [bacterium]
MAKCEYLIRVSLFSLLTSLFAGQGLAVGLDTLHLQPNERILIVAPHPDDEVLACGGLIQQALALGDSVWVVYVTAGDGSWTSAWRVTGNMSPGPKDYLELGRTRIKEARADACLLGLDTTQLVFLGYPDGAMDQLIFEHYYDKVPVTSPHTRVTHNPYGCAGHDYVGEAVTEDLYDLIAGHRADLVIFPHPLDVHPDHWAAGATLAPIIGLWHLRETGKFPAAYYYIVHRPHSPSLNQQDELNPPEGLRGPGQVWYTLPISTQEIIRKRAALNSHWSQFTEFGLADLSGYVARNELFERVENDSGTAKGDAPALGFMPVPRIDSLTASLPRGQPKVFRLYLARAPVPGFNYRLYVWSRGPEQVARTIDIRKDSSNEAQALAEPARTDSAPLIANPICTRAGGTWTVYLPATWFDSDDMVFFAAAVRWKGKLVNHTAVGSVVRQGIP